MSTQPIRRRFAALFAFLAAACSAHTKRPMTTSEFAVGGVARVAGRITSSTGAPLDSVSVRIYLGPPDALYGTPEVFTNRNGEYSVDVTRLAVALVGDSLVHRAVAIVRLARLDTPHAAGPIFRDSVDITFFAPTSVRRTTIHNYTIVMP